jgi:hypothetical protein
MRTDRRAVVDGAGPTGGAKIIAFRRRAPTSKARLPQIGDPLSRIEDEADRRRMRENLAAALIIVLLLGTGYWLIEELRASAHITACLEAGHRNCAPLDAHSAQGRPVR